jgi:hypothetical protein
MKTKLNKFYVYTHKRLDGTPFYVGKGCGNRAYTKDYRNDDWHNEASKGYTVSIVKSLLTEDEAYAVEKKLITNIGLVNLTNISSGKKKVIHLDLIDEAWHKLEDLRILFDIYHNFEEYNKSKYFRDWFRLIAGIEKVNVDIKKILCK